MKMPSYCRDMHPEPADINHEADLSVNIQQNFEELGV